MQQEEARPGRESTSRVGASFATVSGAYLRGGAARGEGRADLRTAQRRRDARCIERRLLTAGGGTAVCPQHTTAHASRTRSRRSSLWRPCGMSLQASDAIRRAQPIDMLRGAGAACSSRGGANPALR